MNLWLVRHARPLVAAGVCYGATDIAADAQATLAAALDLAEVLPMGIAIRYSVLQRCEQLALVLQGLRPDLSFTADARLVEMNFGDWEGQRWDDIPRTELDGWTAAFATWRCGGGESVEQVMARVAAVWDDTCQHQQPTAWITHAGVIRAAALMAQSQRQIQHAVQWPQDAPGFGRWTTCSL